MRWAAGVVALAAIAGCGHSEDTSIVAYGREDSSGTHTYFREHVLGGADFASSVEAMPGTAAVVGAVAQDPRAVGYGGIAYLKGVRVLKVKRDDASPAMEPNQENAYKGAYPLTRNLYFYTAGAPEGLVRSFIDWVRGPEGQKICSEVGYFPVPPASQVASPAAPPDGKHTLSIKGSDTLKLLSGSWAERFTQLHPDCTIQVMGGGSETGLQALLAGEVQVWQSSRPIKPEEAEALKSKMGKGPAEFAVAVDALAVFVNEKNPLQEISIADLRGIYTGKLSRWGEVGHPGHGGAGQ